MFADFADPVHHNGLLVKNAFSEITLTTKASEQFQRYIREIYGRPRFEEIIRKLHFSDNEASEATRMKTWKISSISDMINETFLSVMTVGPRILFDEGMIPMRSRYNPVRQYVRAKPHKWGTKLHTTCDTTSGYTRKYNKEKWVVTEKI
ncbi:Heat shock protein70 [Phytophthora megakarya]|uniref:Heat shock protein70 n=1 Tax=Phytophthora megakarya TaxID=4795 RepID=A0A225WEX5_9STRA|nr:Heat shock protein70 [Phytophthora megakarya]